MSAGVIVTQDTDDRMAGGTLCGFADYPDPRTLPFCLTLAGTSDLVLDVGWDLLEVER